MAHQPPQYHKITCPLGPDMAYIFQSEIESMVYVTAKQI